jgi:HEPN domain-containing protein
MKSKLDVVKGWMRKAEKDLRIARNTLETMTDPPLDAICFHAQQGVEKYLKAFLTYEEIEFPFTHELSDLALLCSTRDKGFESFVSRVTILIPYAVEMRYPEVESEPSLENTKPPWKSLRRFSSLSLNGYPKRWKVKQCV